MFLRRFIFEKRRIMFSEYFYNLEKELIKKYRVTGKASAPKKSKGTFEFPELAEALDGMIPPSLSVSHSRIVDASGYSPEVSELAVYKKPVKNTQEIFKGAIPSGLVYATTHTSLMLDRKTLLEKLADAAHVKKCDRFAEKDSEDMDFIASFIIAFDSSYLMDELKSSVIEIYREQNVESEFEVDIIAILGKGIMIKNWREKRSYVALETGDDTLKWFFILMNEYLDVDKKSTLDLRSFVKDQKTYKEY
jgi:hypothetical protein